MKKRVSIALCVLSILSFLLFSGADAFQENPSSKKVLHLTEKPGNTPFSPAILINNTLFISGQLSINYETGKFEGGTMAEQAERIIKNIEILCKKAGMDLSHVIETTVFISDFNEFREFNNVFVKMFPTTPPTRATVQVAKLAYDAKIEISAIAIK
jgi:2-iminobutanoate/2-iminopropanoate deaminase